MQRGAVAQGAGECARVQRIVRGESAIAVETRSCKRAAARGSAEMTPTPEMGAAEMPTAMVAAATIMRAPMTTAVMTTAVMTTAVSTAMATTVTTAMATTVTTATFRSGISCGRQRGRQHNDGDTSIVTWHPRASARHQHTPTSQIIQAELSGEGNGKRAATCNSSYLPAPSRRRRPSTPCTHGFEVNGRILYPFALRH